MRAATVVQVLHGLFYVWLQLLVVAAIILSFKFHCKFCCKFYCSCDPSFTHACKKNTQRQDLIRLKSKSATDMTWFCVGLFTSRHHRRGGWVGPAVSQSLSTLSPECSHRLIGVSYGVVWDVQQLVYCKFSTECASERIFKIGQHLAKI